MKQKVVSDNSSERGIIERRKGNLATPADVLSTKLIVAGLAHDLKNILGLMQGYLELIMLEDISAENQGKLKPIIYAETNGTEMLNHLIAFCKSDNSPQIEFKSLIRHDELKNILATILGSVEHLMLDTTTSNNQELFEIILDACSRGVKILSQLRAVCIPDSQNSHQPLNMVDVIKESKFADNGVLR